MAHVHYLSADPGQGFVWRDCSGDTNYIDRGRRLLDRFAALVTGSAAGQANDEIGGPCRPAQKQTGLSICRYREVPEGADPGQSMIGTVLMLFFGLPSMTRSL